MWFTPLLGGGQQQLPEVPGILRIPNTLTSQPQTAPQIDWGNPITKGLLDWQAGNFLNGFTPVNTPGTSYSYKGVSKTFINSSSRYLTKTLKSSVGGNLSIVSVARTNSVYAIKGLGGFASTAQRDYLHLLAPYIANPFQLERYQPYSGQNSGGATQDTNWHVHIGVADSNLRYYIDGKGGVAGEVALIPANLYNTLVIGGIYNGALPAYTGFFDGEIALTLFYTRALTEKEAAALSQNPWQVFQAPQKKIFTFPGIDVTTRPIADVSRVVDTPIFRKPRIKRLPSSATPLNLSHPILRGLEQGIIAGPVRNATSRNQYTVRTSIPGAAPFGRGEKLSGSTGYISAPTTNTLGTDSWTSIVYAVVPNTNACALTLVAEFPGSGTSDKGLHISSTGKVVAGLYDVAGGGTSPTVSSVASVVPGVPFLAAAIGTSSSLSCWLNNVKASGVVYSSGYAGFSTPEYVVGYGTFENFGGSASQATIAYALKLNRAITDAEWRSLVQDPWQIFQQVEKPTIVHRAPDIDVRKTPLFFAPSRKKFPSDATPLNLGHPILRGLEQGIIAGPVRNATSRNQYTVRTSIPGAAPFGVGEQLSGSTGYISAPTSISSPWTYIVYGVVPSIGANCALLAIADGPGSSTYDRSLSLSASGAAQARIYHPAPYGYDQITTTTKTVTPGVPFIAAAVATGSELIAYLDYNKVSAATVSAGYNVYAAPVLIAGYGGPGQTTSSNATIAYALKLNRAITDAEWNSLVQDPWQIFMPGVKRVLALPTFVSPWTSNISNESLYDDVDDTSTNDGEYIISSPATSGVVGDPVIFNLSKTLPQGTHTVRARAKKSATLGEVRAVLLDSNNLPVGTSAWQPLSNTFRTYELAITTTGSASRVKFDTVGSSVSTGIPSNGLALYYDASNTLSYPGSGTTITDLSGRKYNGTFTNGAVFSPANGGSIRFDGTDDYVNIPGMSTSFGGSGGTFLVWLRRNGTQGAYAGVIWSRVGALYHGLGFLDGSNGDLNQLHYAWNGLKSRVNLPQFIVPDNVWVMAVVRGYGDWGGDMTLYNSGSKFTYFNGIYHGGAINLSDLKLGAEGLIAGRYFKGNIGIAAVYDRAISDAEIEGIYNSTKGRFQTYSTPNIVTNGLVLHLDAGSSNSYPGSGTTWTDLSGNGNNGTLTNGPTYSSANGGAIVFDGADDYVEITGNVSNTPSSMTLFCFIYPKNPRAEEIIATQNNGFGYRFMSRIFAGTKWGFRPDDIGPEYEGTTQLSNNTWYCLAVTHTASNLILYLNGNIELNQATPFSLAHGGNIRLGDGIGWAQAHLQADLPIFMMYNRALTQAEIQQNFNALRDRFGI